MVVLQGRAYHKSDNKEQVCVGGNARIYKSSREKDGISHHEFDSQLGRRQIIVDDDHDTFVEGFH